MITVVTVGNNVEETQKSGDRKKKEGKVREVISQIKVRISGKHPIPKLFNSHLPTQNTLQFYNLLSSIITW